MSPTGVARSQQRCATAGNHRRSRWENRQVIKARVAERFGIKHRMVEGGMQWVGRAELTSAVANAGALGFLTGLTQPTPEDLRKEIKRCREMTDQPFGVNLTILPTLVPRPYAEYIHPIIASCGKIVEPAGNN